MHAGLDLKLQTEPFKRSAQTQNMFPSPCINDEEEEQKPLQFCMSTSNNVQEEVQNSSMFVPDLMRPPGFCTTTIEGLLDTWDTSMVQETDYINSNKVTTSIMGEGSGSGNISTQFQFNGFGDLIESSSLMRAPNLGIGEGRGMGFYQNYTYQSMLSVNENGDGNGNQINIPDPIAENERANAAQRRQRRMIKNRESAARSRARRQAYDTQLQFENESLKKENELLRKVIRDLSTLVKGEKPMKGPVRSFSGPF